MYKARFLPKAEKQLRKIRERQLIEAFRECIKLICKQPYKNSKVGDLKGLYAQGFNYQGTAYRVAYLIDTENKIIHIIGLGSHEGFWDEIKKYMK